MRRHIARSVVALFLISAFYSPLSAQKSSIKAGIVLITEGEVFLDGNPLQLKDGVRGMHSQTISTKQGRAELIWASTNVSLGENALLRMEQSDPKSTGLRLEKGSILIEVVRNLTDPVRVRILDSTVEISKPGLYRLDSTPCELRVYGGTALADNGSKKVQVKREKEVRLDGDLSQTNFDLKDSDTLHQWSAQRSYDIFFTNPETDNWKWTGPMPSAQTPYPVGFVVNSNYQVRFKAQIPPKYAQRIRPKQGMDWNKTAQDAADRLEREKNAQTEQQLEQILQQMGKQPPHP